MAKQTFDFLLQKYLKHSHLITDIEDISLTYLPLSGGTLSSGLILNGGFRFTSGAVSGYVLTSDDIGNASWLPVIGDGSGAPDSASYVVIGTNASLSAERVLTGTSNQVILTDNGANSSIVLSLPQSIHSGATPTFTGLNLGAFSLSLAGNASLSGTNTGDQDLSGYVPTSRTVNGHALSANVSVTASDLGLGSVENTALSTWAGSTNLNTIANDTVTYARMQNVSAADKILGRVSIGAGDVEEIDCTAAGRALLDDAAAINQRETLGLGDSSTKNVGSIAGTVAAGDDSRLSDARTPTAHAVSHKTGGSDSIKLDELSAATDVTTLNSSASAHGLLPKLSGSSSDSLKGDGTWGSGGFPEALGYIGY